MNSQETYDIDKIDVFYFLGSLITIAYTTPVAAILAIPLGYLQYRIRRTKWFERRAAELNGLTAKPVQFLLPPPKTNNDHSLYTKEIQTTSAPVDRSKLAFWERVTLPADSNISIDTIRSVPVKPQPIIDLSVLLQRVPSILSYKNLPDPPTNTSVPIGYDLIKKEILWMDLAKDFVHGLVAGMTGTGKDALLRLWYVFLTSYNSPRDIQFVILDGKNEWMLPSLACSPYMFIPPAGGIDLIRDEKGRRKLGSTERMSESLDKVFDEIERRQKLFSEAGATNLATYQVKTSNVLPRLVIIATDVGEDFEGDLETLVRILTMKARSFGINLIISMQTSSKKDTGWRSNLSLAISGYQALQSADQPIMGINATNIKYRPSQLPNPEEYEIAKGLFALRKGSYQTIVKTFHLPDDIFEQYIDTIVGKSNSLSEDDMLVQYAMKKYGNKLQQKVKEITPLDFIQADYATYTPEVNEWMLPQEDRIKVIKWRQAGWNKTRIMTEGLKYTSGPYYRNYSYDVDRLITITDKAMRKA